MTSPAEGGVLNARTVSLRLLGAQLSSADVFAVQACIAKKIAFKGLRVKGKLGSGFFGSVFALGDDLCAKIEKIETFIKTENPLTLGNVNVRARIEAVRDISIRAGELGIGPKVVDAFTCFPTHMGAFYIIVMERLTGPTLREYIRTASQAESIAMIKRVRAMIEDLNAAGISHNDAHFQNILIVDGAPRLIDFGVSTFGVSSDVMMINSSHMTMSDEDVSARIIQMALASRKLNITL